jgi:hypothetical protein
MKNLPTVSETEIQRQLKKLKTDWKATKSNLIYLTQRGLIPQPVAGHRGGKGIKIIRPGETAPEIVANRELIKVLENGGLGLTLDQTRIIRRCARDFYELITNMTPENSRRSFNNLSDIFEGKEWAAVPIMYWLHKRNMALIDLYGEAVVDDRPLWGMPELLCDYITYLSRGLMRDWSINEQGTHFVRPETAKSKSDEIYIAGVAERAIGGLSAKLRD